MRATIDRIKHNAGYSTSELSWLVLSACMIGFSFGFSKWGYITFDPAVGLLNTLRFSAFAFISLFVLDFARRCMASWMGYKATFVPWKSGIILGLVAAFLSQGTIFLWFTHGFVLKVLPELKMGQLQARFRIEQKAKIAGFGLICLMLLGFLFGVLSNTFPQFVQALYINSLIAVYACIPQILIKIFDKSVPVNDGSALVLGSFKFTIFTFSILIIGYIGAYFIQSFWMLILAPIFGLIMLFWYMLQKEL